MLFDSHAHYDDERFDGDRGVLLTGLAERGVGYVLNVGCDIQSSERSLRLADTYGFVWATAGIHPHNAQGALRDAGHGVDFEARLTELLAHPRAVALGEIGLDFHYDFSPRDAQREVFERQLALAGRLRLPVVIHDRDAHDETVAAVRAAVGSLCGGVFHCFSGGRELARRVLDLGFYIAFGGALTFKNAQGLAEAAAYVPPDRLLVETDCPYLAPVPHRGQRNDSSRLGLIADRLAQIRGCDRTEIERLTTENAKRLFAVGNGMF